MENLTSIGALGLVVALVIVVIAVQQFQQNAQYREIQERLREIRRADMLEKQSLAIRTERSGLLDSLTMLEANLQGRGVNVLTPDELTHVDTVRGRVKALNDTLIGNRQWMGAPFDLEWHEVLERLPIVRAAYLAAGFAEQAQTSETAPDSPPLTSFSGTSAPLT